MPTASALIGRFENPNSQDIIQVIGPNGLFVALNSSGGSGTVPTPTAIMVVFNPNNQDLIQTIQPGGVLSTALSATGSSGGTPTPGAIIGVFENLAQLDLIQTIDGNGNVSAVLMAAGSFFQNLVFTVTDSTIVATWNTPIASSSGVFAGSKAGIDNGYQTAVTAHEAIVTGLNPSTVYQCYVQSGSMSSPLIPVLTNASQSRSIFSSASIGTVTETSADGDTLYNFVSNDNVTYICRDDSSSPGGSANMSLNKLTNESNLTIASVNILSAFGTEASSNGTDGPGGSAMSYKQSGLFGMAGNLYMFETRTPYGSPQTQWYYNLLKDNGNHGASWNNPQALTTYDANGNPPAPGVGMFADSTIGWVVPVRYAVDDGTMGYNTPGNQIDGANGFVYMTFTDGYWNNGSHLYLMRVPRVYIQNAANYQFWNGPSSPAPSDFVNDANWSNTSSTKVPIYTASGQTSAPDLVFVPARNCYLLLEWYQSPNGTASNTVWNIYSGPTPAGPWTEIMTQTFNPQGWYNPVVLHRTVATNTQTSNVQLGIACTGDYVGGAYYKASYATMTLN